MLYIGHFSFSSRAQTGSNDSDSWHGHFTGVVEAADLSAALTTLAALIQRSGAPNGPFGGFTEVYLDTCLKVKSVPQPGFLGYVFEKRGIAGPSLSVALPGLKESCVSAYQGRPRSTDPDAAYSPEPFLVLQAKSQLERQTKPPRGRVH